MIGVALVSVHMGAVRTSKMVRAGWPGPEAPQDLVPWVIVCVMATIFDKTASCVHVPGFSKRRPRTAYSPGRTDLPISTPGVGRRKWTSGRI